MELKGGLKPIKNYPPSDYVYHTPQNWGFLQDKHGILYVANQAGLLMFDGKYWDVVVIPNDNVRSIDIDEHGMIFIGGNNEFGYLEMTENRAVRYHSLSVLLEKPYKTFSNVFNTICTSQGVFFRCKKYLFRWRQGRMKTWVAEKETKKNFDGLFACKGRVLVHGKAAGLMEVKSDMKGDRLEILPGGERFKGNFKITFVVPDGPEGKSLLVGTRTKGVYKYSDNSFQRFYTGSDHFLINARVYKGIRLSKTPGFLALATMSGGLVIMKEDGGFHVNYNKSTGLISDVIYAVYEDQTGGLWLATDKGISKIEYSSPITIYDDRLNLEGLALSVTSHGGSIVVGASTGIYRWTKSHRFQREPGIDGMCSGLLSVDDTLLAAVHKGLYIVRENNPARPLIDTGTYALTRSVTFPARVWAGTAEGLISLKQVTKGGTRPQWQVEKRFKNIDGPVKSIVEDDSGTLWLGTGTLRLYRVSFQQPGNLNRCQVSRIAVPDDLPESSIRAFSAANHVIFATQKGIYRFNSRTRRLEPDPALGPEFSSGSRPVFLIKEAPNRRIWFYSQGKIFLAIPSDKGNHDIRSLAVPGLASYQLYDVFNDTNPAIAWLAGDRGLIRYDTAKSNSPGFPMYIRRVEVMRVESPIESGLEVPYDRRHIRFRFAAPFFIDEAATHYSYLLEGTDKEWSDWSSEGSREYAGLEPGAYRFHVKARNVFGRESKETAFEFVVLPPWYRSWWAYSIYIAALLMIVYGGFRWRLLKLRRDKQRLERLIGEATVEIREKNIQLQEQAQELKEMAAVRSRFFTNISHEFRTPLTMILGPLDQLIAGAKNEGIKPLKMMKRNAQRLLTLINQLLALSRIDRGKMKLRACQQNIAHFLKGILALFELSARNRKIEIQFKSESDEIPLYFDTEKLEDVFCNLLLNVINLTPVKGGIEVSLTPNACEADHSGASFLEIAVLAVGLEIPEHQMEHMFDRFYLAEEAYEDKPKGYGIGLALAKELITLHRGHLAARREEKNGVFQGTCFIICLPMGHGHLEPREIVQTCAEDYEPRSLNTSGVEAGKSDQKQLPQQEDESGIIVLLVEDNADTREFIIESLSPDYKIVEAENGREGIKKAREIIPDLIISDIIMPYMDGYKLCQQLKKDVRTSHIPIILLTAKSGEESVLRGLETGADDYITKPFNLSILQARIKNLIEIRRQSQLKMERQMVLQPSDVAVSPIDEEFIKELQAEIEKNLADPDFGVEELAQKLYMSRATLYRKIHALTGESPHRFIRSFRLKRSAQLFKANFGNVGEVAIEVGFNNISYFSQCFKEKFHLLPSEYLNAETEPLENSSK